MIIFRKYKSFLLCIVLGEESLNEEEEEKDTTSHLRGISKTELRCELDVTGLSLHTHSDTDYKILRPIKLWGPALLHSPFVLLL